MALAPPEDPLNESSQAITYEVVEQTIHQSLRFAAVAEWETSPMLRAWAPGVVTSVAFTDGDSIDAGDVLFTVDLRPVVVAAGEVPAFRDLQVGEDGADVAQLQDLLVRLGFLEEAESGAFDDATAAAVRAWQRSLDVNDDGVVRRGDVVFAPELPARVVATEALAVGAPLSGGEIVVNRLAPAPSMVIPLAPEQRELVPLTGRVWVAYAEGTWQAVIARAVESSEQGSRQLNLILEAMGGGPVCGDACIDWIEPTGTASFEADIVVVPETTGPTVPVAAIATDPGGGHSVQLVDVGEVAVEVLASTGGIAVVSGVEAGDVLVLPFPEPTGD